MMSLCVLLIFLGLSALSVPVPVALGLSGVVTLWYFDLPLSVAMYSMYTGINSFILIAVPLFIVAGYVMERGGLSERLFAAAETFVGKFRGGVGSVNIIASFVFGGISGSSVADVASLGPITVRAMTSRGYPLNYTASLILITSTLATLVPPSILIIVAAAAANQSVGKALAGGLGPGIVLAVALLVYNYYVSRKKDYGSISSSLWKERISALIRAVPSLGAPIVILLGMFSGVFTPTEAAAIAVIYTLFIAVVVHRDLPLAQIPDVIIKSGYTAGSVLLILMSANIVNYIFVVDRLPAMASEYLTALTSNPSLVLLLMGVIFLIVGMLMDIVAGALMLIPILMPTVHLVGIDPLHFLIFMSVALAVGLATPPVGTCLFATSYVTKVPIERLAIATIPFYLINIAVIVLVAFVPQIVLLPADWLTNL